MGIKHLKGFRKLGRGANHRRAMFRTMVTQLLKHERIQTTVPKAKELRKYAEKMITYVRNKPVKRALTKAHSFIREKEVVNKLFDTIKPRYAVRPGGYTRILKCGYRYFDKAPMAYIELVDSEKELGRRLPKRERNHTSLDDLRKKVETSFYNNLYEKDILHVSENPRTAALGGMSLLLEKIRGAPKPTPTKVLTPPSIIHEFVNIANPKLKK
eukprot:TRINITY_DN2194_c0_g1_i1.p1 TRINITY_DN2194_c0_g1~~TRINITY_DN2194_c0_g1_i1.p1  ORF type:complete len:213 (+),score=43.15 TRINITY_DN2194_c0_g1_i1:73-711(+)